MRTTTCDVSRNSIDTLATLVVPGRPVKKGVPGAGQGLRRVQLALHRREQEREPSVVLDGRLRHLREDAALRRAPGGQTQGFRRAKLLVAIDRRARWKHSS